MQIRIVVIDDFPLVREGLAVSLDDPGIHVVGQAGDGEEGLRLIEALRPDVALVDLHMPGMSGIDVVRAIGERFPDVKAIIVSASEKADALLESVAAGAAAYLSKRSSCEELRQAVITVHGGDSVISPGLVRHLIADYARGSRGDQPSLRPLLARRERDVLRLVAAGRTDKEIAGELYISPRTVQNHLTSIREKTGQRRRTELARWALEHEHV